MVSNSWKRKSSAIPTTLRRTSRWRKPTQKPVVKKMPAASVCAALNWRRVRVRLSIPSRLLINSNGENSHAEDNRGRAALQGRVSPKSSRALAPAARCSVRAFHRPLLFSAILFIAITLPASAQTQPANSASTCLSCPRPQTVDQPSTPMGRALMLPGTNPVVKDHPKLIVRKGDYSYTVETRGDATTYSVTDGTRTISIPVRWSFGLGGQTWILEHDGELYERLVSYYPNVGGLDTTIGDERIVPHTLDEAMGRKLAPGETKACFGCHAINAVRDRKLTIETMKPGVTCEHCHVGANTHLLDAVQGDFSSTPPKLGQLSSEDLSNFCGQCHRTWEGVVRGHFHGEINVRFQPYRLANSKCFDAP